MVNYRFCGTQYLSRTIHLRQLKLCILWLVPPRYTSSKILATTILFHFYHFDYLSFVIWVVSCISFSVSGYLSLSIRSSRFLSVVANGKFLSFIFFLKTEEDPTVCNTIFSLSVRWSVHIEFASLSWLLWIVAHWTWSCRYLFKILISVPLDGCTQVE